MAAPLEATVADTKKFSPARLADWVTQGMALVGASWMALLAVLICTEVFARGLFNHPIAGLNEFVGLSIVPIMFLQLPAVLLTGKLFRVEILTGRLQPSNPTHALFGVCYSLVLLALLAMAGPWMLNEAVKAWVTNDYAGVPGAFQLPTWPFRWAAFIGCAAMIAVGLFILVRDLGTVLRNREVGALINAKTLIFVCTVAAFGVSLFFLPDSPVLIGAIFIVWLFVLLGLGFPIATILLGLSVVGIFVIRENFRVTEVTLGLSLTKSMGTMEFAAIPLFITMGLILDKARLGEDAFQVAAYFMRRLRGGLAIATVTANAVFASVVGSSIASAAVFSRVAVPPMIAAGYPARAAVGTVAGSSVLGMLIPPSLLLIVYGLIAEVSIGKLFVAAIVPGLLLSLAFAGVAFLMAPKLSKAVEADDVPRMGAGDVVRKLWPVTVLIVVILGGIYSGWFTATESAGVGLVLSVIIAMARGTLPLKVLARATYEAGLISAAMLLLMAAAGTYSRLLAFAQLPMTLNEMLIAADLSYYALMLVFVLIVLALGAVLDTVSIILIITPIVLPLVHQMGADPIWFGIVLVIATEVGLLTPPFGVSAYTVREVLSDRDIKLSDIFIGSMPFVLAMLGLVALLVVMPVLTTILL